MLGFLLCTIAVFSEQACDFEAKSFHTIAQVEACLNQLKINTTEKTLIKNNVEAYLSNSIYSDTYLDIAGDYAYLKQDLIGKLNAIPADTDSNFLTFHQAISTAVESTYDANTYYQFPCSQYFTYVFPFHFDVTATEDAPGTYTYATTAQISLTEGLTKHHVDHPNVDITGKTVTKIQIGSSDENTDNPVVRIAKWAEDNVHLARTPAARLNYALASEFEIRSFYRYQKPESIIITYLDGAETKTTTVPFYVQVSTNVTDPELLCPRYEQPAPVTDEIAEEPIDLPLEMPQIPTHVNEETLMDLCPNGTFITGYYTKINDKITAVMRIYFNASEIALETKFARDLEMVIALIPRANITRLIIDLRGSSGDRGELVNGLIWALFPNAFPFNPAVQCKSTPQTIAILNTIYNPQNGYMYTDPLDITHIPVSKLTTETTAESHTGEFGGVNVTRTANWTKPFTINGDSVNRVRVRLSEQKTRPLEVSINPENVIVVTDGRCGAGCGLFVKQLKQMKLARIYGVGAALARHADYPTTSSALDAGTTVGTKIYSSRLFTPDPATTSNYEAPKLFARKTSLLSFPVFRILNFAGDTTKAMGLTIVEPDAALPLAFPKKDDFTNTSLKAFMDLVSPKFEKCFSWERRVPTDATKCPEVATDANALYGFPCAADGTFPEEGTCEFVRCKAGYYRTPGATPKCEKIPIVPLRNNTEEPIPDKPNKFFNDYKTYIIAGGAAIVFVVVVVAVCCLAMAFRRRNKRKQQRQMDDFVDKKVEGRDVNAAITPGFVPTATTDDSLKAPGQALDAKIDDYAPPQM